MGIRGYLFSWIATFLYDQEQRVLVEGQSFQWMKVISGVPQGFILGPLLFLVNINDLNAGLSSTVRLFADDCAIFRVVTNMKDCDDLHADLNWVYYWTQLWQLNLNQSKCKVMRITNKRNKFHYTYSLNTHPWNGLTLLDILG